MAAVNKMLSRFVILIAALLSATMAMNPKPFHASPKTQYLKLSKKSMTGAEGSNIQVNCSVSMSQTPAELKWELKQDEKSNVEQLRLSENTVTLRITSLKRTNAGQFTCLVIMPDGDVEEEEFMLLVQQANDEVCSKYQFKCEKTRICLFIKYRCDNVDDCGDGSDEQCDVDPCFEKFVCNSSKRCLEKEYVCDGKPHCEDHSDEHHCHVVVQPTTTAPPVVDDSTYAWFQITVSSFIAVTLGLVFFISFIVIMVFRNRVRRLREQRLARALQHMYQEDVRRTRHLDTMGGPGEPLTPNHGDQQQFLLGPPHPHYGNIIVNVNNGVQYIPGYDYSLMMEVPPPYSEVSTTGAGDSNPPPPAYSTLEHQRMGGASRRVVSQPAASNDDGASETAPLRQPRSAEERCATVAAPDVGGGDEGCSSQHIGSPRRNDIDTSNNTQTLPPGIEVSPLFLHSLLNHCTQNDERNSTQTIRDPKSVAETQRIRDVSNIPATRDNQVDIVHLTASPRHRGGGQEGGSSSHQGEMRAVSRENAATAGGSEVTDFSVNTDSIHLDDECSQSLLSHEHRPAEDCGASEEEDSIAATQNEDSTFLLRRPKQRTKQEKGSSETMSSSHKGRNEEDACNALLNEVSKRDDKLRPKPGHLTVQGGEILLHTPTGVVTDSRQAPTSLTPPALAAPDSPEAPELTIQNGALVFGSPKSLAPENVVHQSNQSQTPCGSIAGATVADPELLPLLHPPESSSLTQSEHNVADDDITYACTAAASPNELSDTLRRKELQFKNGEFVLESPKHTPSAQILSHLKGAYAEEEGMAEVMEPVVNTKRTGGSGAAKPQVQKFNSDVVLPPKSYQQ